MKSLLSGCSEPFRRVAHPCRGSSPGERLSFVKPFIPTRLDPLCFIKTSSPSLPILSPICLFPRAKPGARWGKFRDIHHCQHGGAGVFITTPYTCFWARSCFSTGVDLDPGPALASLELQHSRGASELPSQSPPAALIPSNNPLFKGLNLKCVCDRPPDSQGLCRNK